MGRENTTGCGRLVCQQLSDEEVKARFKKRLSSKQLLELAGFFMHAAGEKVSSRPVCCRQKQESPVAKDCMAARWR